jgi:DNA-binding response OmpR family regulator
MSDAKTILLVDDDHDMRAGLRAVLQQRGYRTLEADDGRTAAQLIDGQRPDLVILDLMMPRWGGLQVLENYAGQAGAPPFIMITGSDGADLKADAEKNGVFEYLRKPFPMDRLLDGVDRALRGPEGAASRAPAAPRVTIRCRCSVCAVYIKAPVQARGQTHPCPNCASPFVVAPCAPDDAGPMLAS